MPSSTFSPSEVQWGPDDAETDRNLLEYFVAPDFIDQLIALQKTFVIGRKGTGKSALIRRLEDDFRKRDDTVYFKLTPSHSLISSAFPGATLSASFFQEAWLLKMYQQAFSEIGVLQGDKFASGSFSKAREYARQRHSANPDIVEMVHDLIGRFDPKVKVGGMDMSMALKQEVRNQMDLDGFEIHLREICHEKKLVFFLDDLDHFWDNSDQANALLVGLLYARDHIRRLSYKNPIHCYMFLRDDIYQILLSKTPDSDKLRDVFSIEWTEKKVKSILAQRIRFSMKKKGYSPSGSDDTIMSAVFPDKVGPKGYLRWIMERTFYGRPRDVIQLVRLYTDELIETKNTPNGDAFRRIEPQYSQIKTEDLCSEYMHQYPRLLTLLSAWRREAPGYPAVSTQEEFAALTDTLIKKCEGSISEAWFSAIVNGKDRVQELASVLYSVGVLGDGKEQDVQYRSAWHNPTFASLTVHPIHRDYLRCKIGKSNRAKTGTGNSN